MKELDLLKKDWKKNENSFEQVSEIDIYKMIHKKSSSIVKWILIISILEILLWTAVNICFDTDHYTKPINAPGLMFLSKSLNYCGYAITLVFVYLFYRNYIKISATVSTKYLMKDILRTRKTVQYYVIYNLAMIIINFIIAFIISLKYVPEITLLSEKIANNSKVMLITVVVAIMTIAVFFGFFWLFYRLLYGILLRRLLTNYKELKKIDL
ncbi:hypothetical protein HNQ02_001047 [Flavobacterium sp. 7E]|uniref:hypothetical protein n=1 Tax=unclassified Flavobacterium TaxID=196869 RepID=UPI001570F70F|nr:MULTISPECIES: hypothetical protein [unclassified Flavobacterium]MBE0391334.1 hypothetical protein [Flavobacterium sp. PL002]NRS88133.1 hypothetical protein [Flavobacterium sp. 7E]NRT15702.1 hypothetical protein [Flavobacterium sp. 28A]